MLVGQQHTNPNSGCIVDFQLPICQSLLCLKPGELIKYMITFLQHVSWQQHARVTMSWVGNPMKSPGQL